MKSLLQFILGHEQGGVDVLADYVNLLIMSDLTKAPSNMLARAPLTVFESDERYKREVNLEKAQDLTSKLMEKGWGYLPWMKEYCEYFLKEDFPEDYEGISFVEESSVIDDIFYKKNTDNFDSESE